MISYAERKILHIYNMVVFLHSKISKAKEDIPSPVVEVLELAILGNLRQYLRHSPGKS